MHGLGAAQVLHCFSHPFYPPVVWAGLADVSSVTYDSLAFSKHCITLFNYERFRHLVQFTAVFQPNFALEIRIFSTTKRSAFCRTLLIIAYRQPYVILTDPSFWMCSLMGYYAVETIDRSSKRVSRNFRETYHNETFKYSAPFGDTAPNSVYQTLALLEIP